MNFVIAFIGIAVILALSEISKDRRKRKMHEAFHSKGSYPHRPHLDDDWDDD